jgi:pyruvate-ferredoxin/flavodoxin oxidoreductase
MGSGYGPVHEVTDFLNDRGEKVGYVNVHLFRPFSIKHLMDAIPPTSKRIAVLDRCKEPGLCEPLYMDVISALHNDWEFKCQR